MPLFTSGSGKWVSSWVSVLHTETCSSALTNHHTQILISSIYKCSGSISSHTTAKALQITFLICGRGRRLFGQAMTPSIILWRMCLTTLNKAACAEDVNLILSWERSHPGSSAWASVRHTTNGGSTPTDSCTSTYNPLQFPNSARKRIMAAHGFLQKLLDSPERFHEHKQLYVPAFSHTMSKAT